MKFLDFSHNVCHKGTPWHRPYNHVVYPYQIYQPSAAHRVSPVKAFDVNPLPDEQSGGEENALPDKTSGDVGESVESRQTNLDVIAFPAGILIGGIIGDN